MHGDQEPVGARNTRWLTLGGMVMGKDEGWTVNRTARAAPGVWPGVAGRCHATGVRRGARRDACWLGVEAGRLCPAPLLLRGSVEADDHHGFAQGAHALDQVRGAWRLVVPEHD